MKKTISILAAALLICATLTGCSSQKETVATDGSTSMEKVIGVLGEAFEADTSISVTYNPTGSGIKAVAAGSCDIGLSSRNLKDEGKSQGLNGTVLAYDGIAIIVNPENTVDDLDIDTIAKIYTGEIGNWSEIGGNDAEIVLIGREAGSGTRDGFESITGTSDKCKYRQELTSTGDVITTVSQNPDAIGYASVASVKAEIIRWFGRLRESELATGKSIKQILNTFVHKVHLWNDKALISLTLRNAEETITFEEIREFEQMLDEIQKPLSEGSENGSCKSGSGSCYWT